MAKTDFVTSLLVMDENVDYILNVNDMPIGIGDILCRIANS